MSIKECEMIKPTVIFSFLNGILYYEYEEILYEANFFNINKLKENISNSYKVAFNNIPVNIVVDIIEKLKNEDTDIFVYRIKNPKTNNVNYYGILNDKVKKLTK